MAEGVFSHVAAEAGHSERFVIESAGTGDWHIGNPPDPRAVAAAGRRGIDLSQQRARQVRVEDFEAFDLVIAMDHSNHANLSRMAPDTHAHKIQLLLDHLPESGGSEVPDPYYGGDEGFEEVLDLIEAASRALLARLT